MKNKSIAIAALTAALALPAGFMTTAAYAAPAQPAVFQERPWDQPPDEYRDAQRQGFHDGIEAARRDWQDHRKKDADDHERYKHPPVDRQMHDQYREGFKHGYSEAMHHMKDMRNEDHHDRY